MADCRRGGRGRAGLDVGAGHLGPANSCYIGRLFASCRVIPTDPDNDVCTPPDTGPTCGRCPTSMNTLMDGTDRVQSAGEADPVNVGTTIYGNDAP